MVRHDLHLQDGEPMAFCSIKEYFLQTDLPPLVQDLPPVLRTEDNVVLTAIYQMVCFMVLFGLLIFFIHNSIILQKLLSYKKNGTFIRYPKGIGRFHPHGHKILGLSRLVSVKCHVIRYMKYSLTGSLVPSCERMEVFDLLKPPSYFSFLICHFLRRMADFYKKIFPRKKGIHRHLSKEIQKKGPVSQSLIFKI